MWPIQTITLLLCLTDDEQLFAQCIPAPSDLPVIEVAAPDAQDDPTTLELDLAVIGDL